MVADGETVHPPPPQPVSFPPTAQRAEGGSEGRNDTENDVDQDSSGDTQQDHLLAPDRLEDYLQMEEAIFVLREEIEDLQYALCATRDEGPQYEFPPFGGNYYTKETQWTSTAPTEESTIIETDTGSEIISTLTTASK